MQGAVTRGNFNPFTLKNQKFRLENKMDGVIPFEKLQKKWAVTVTILFCFSANLSRHLDLQLLCLCFSFLLICFQLLCFLYFWNYCNFVRLIICQNFLLDHGYYNNSSQILGKWSDFQTFIRKFNGSWIYTTSQFLFSSIIQIFSVICLWCLRHHFSS